MKKNFKLHFLFSLFPLASLPVISLSCNSKPILEIKRKQPSNSKEPNSSKWINPSLLTSDGKIKGSASAFKNEILKYPNILDKSDPAYNVFEYEESIDAKTKEKIKTIKKDKYGNNILNENKTKHIFKDFYNKYFNFANLLNNYHFRMYAFTWDEMAKHFPYAIRSYSQYKGKKNVLFMTLYWVERKYEDSIGWFDALQKSQNKVSSDNSSVGLGTVGLEEGDIPYEEAHWPYYPGIVHENKFLTSAIDPVPMEFEYD
ncbi:hypothetical protein [Metamycoplasma buccale]|uniref:hypothetical protein n=1 Tax=Metamycoplasma buccale TaxID=55602 RepID=UPI00398ECB2C